MLPPDGAQQGGSGLVVEGDDDGSWRKIRVVMKSGAPTERERETERERHRERERESVIEPH